MTTRQEMYFANETDMLSAIDWLETNQVTPTDYTIVEQGGYPNRNYYYLSIDFANMDPQALAYYTGVAEFLYEPPVPTSYELYFATSTDLATAVGWLDTNQSSPTEYEILSSGQFPGESFYYLAVQFNIPDPNDADFMTANGSLLIDPWSSAA